MAQSVKTLAAKPNNLSLILGTHMVEGQNWRPSPTGCCLTTHSK